jgi:hypothetical protein
MSTLGTQGGESTVGEEEMQDHIEMEEDSSSNVSILEPHGTFMVDIQDGMVSGVRYSTKCHRVVVNVSEDLLNRLIQDYRLVSPERVKNVVWSFFKKYGSKKGPGATSTLSSQCG